MADLQPAAAPPSPLLSWLRLCRAPNVFTAVADIAMGFLVARHAIDLVGSFVCLALGSACLYTAGMVLNDVFDIEVDRRERPFRPLPSGQIGFRTAQIFGMGLLVVGFALGAVAGWLGHEEEIAIRWRSGAIAAILAACVLFYDGILKKTPLGPLGMGLCRFFNVLLGMSVAQAQHAGGPSWLLYYEPAQFLPAAGIGTYIVGVTWFARSEAEKSPVLHLLGGMAVMVAGIVVVGWWGHDFRPLALNAPPNRLYAFWLLLAVMLLVGQRRCLEALMDPSPPMVQAAVKQCILSLILFDAAIAAFAAGPVYGLGVALLLAPMLLLGRWVYST